MQAIVRFALSVAGAAVLALIGACAPSEAGSEAAGTGAESEPPSAATGAVTTSLAVQAVEVARGPFIDPVRTSGNISGTREAVVVSETQGIMQEVNFELGDSVEEGEVLVALNSDVERLNMEQAAAQYRSAQLELETTQRLFEQGNASEAQLRRAEAGARGAEAGYEGARKAFEDRTIEAPFTGRVASKGDGIDAGNFLGTGTQIARIIDTSRMQVSVTVGERQVLYLNEGDPARIQVAGCPDSIYEGEVFAIAAGSDRSTGGFTTVIRWTSECGPEVRAGMTAEVTIEPGGLPDALLVPAGAIVSNPEGNYVYRVENGVARRREIEIGERLGDRANVLSGIEAGDLVVVSALSSIEDGAPIQAEVIGTTEELL
ncbi:MAG: efflux RND transporter periplasmic adaptor subunit [bacterium]